MAKIKPGRNRLITLSLFCLNLALTRAVQTEEDLIGYKLTLNKIREPFQRFLEEDETAKAYAALNEYALHHQVVRDFCEGYYENENNAGKSSNPDLHGCTYEEYYACLEVIRKPYENLFDPGRARIDPKKVLGLWYTDIQKTGTRSKCARIHKPTREEFMAFVARSEPVIITGLVSEWDASKKWTWKYLLEHMKDDSVVVSVSPNPYFDGPEEATLWDKEQFQKGEYVVARPAQLTVPFEKYVQLLKSPYSDNSTYFYLQYMPLKLFNGGKLADDIDRSSLKFADFLDEKLQLLWLGDGRNGGAIHNDRQENLMAMISGTKVFRLVPPLPEMTDYLYAGMPMRGGSLKFRWTKTVDPATGLFKTEFVRDINSLSEVNPYQSYTAVRIDKPEYERFPKSKKLNVIECHVKQGEILYNPAHWWHEVTSTGDSTGKSLGVNWFFAPLYNHIFTNDTFWEPNRNYMPIGKPIETVMKEKNTPLKFSLSSFLNEGYLPGHKTVPQDHHSEL